jgi:diaminopimelate decarboxylase/aspartate kinase
MRVIKLGGTSQSLKGYTKIMEIINDTIKENKKIVIVLSAVSGVTNLLEKYVLTKDCNLIDDVINKNKLLIIDLNQSFKIKINIDNTILNLKVLVNKYNETDDVHIKAAIIGYGEVLSTNILYELITLIPGTKQDRVKLGNSYNYIKSKKETSKLYPSLEFYCDNSIVKEFDNCNVLITQGFIASTPSNKTILLGRGGSDTTGALIANTLEAEEYQVWTDVDGIYTADPRVVKDAQLMKKVKYEIVQEMAGMGAKVMHPYSILPCQEKKIPIKIYNTFSGNKENTIICDSDDKVFCVTVQKDVTLFKITSLSMWDSYGFVYDIFKRFSDKKVNVNIITTSQFSISTTTDEKDKNILNELYEDLSEIYQVEMTHNKGIISLVTNDMNTNDKLGCIKYDKYELIHYSPNNLTKSYVINQNDSNELINEMHSGILEKS